MDTIKVSEMEEAESINDDDILMVIQNGINKKQRLRMLELDGGGVTGDTFPIGAITGFAGETPPENWLICDGSEVSRTVYAKLFSAIGTAYGSGDGSTTFNLPDLRSKVGVGLDSRDNDFDTLGKTGGEKAHTLTVQEMPSHIHDGLYWSTSPINYPISLDNGSASTGYKLSWSAGATPISERSIKVAVNGGDQAHNNLQPYIVTNYIIKAYQSSGVVATVVDNLNSNSSTDALSARQGKILNEMNSGLTTVLSTALGETTGLTTPTTLLETTIATAGVYLFKAIIPINYYGQSGRELFCRLLINDAEKGICGGIINTYAYAVYSPLIVMADVPANANIKITMRDATGKTYACPQFELQYIRLK